MINVGNNIKLNVRPVFIGFVHKYYYEGPCRFAEGEALTPEFDIMLNAQQYADAKAKYQAELGDKVNLLEPVYVERTCDWDSSEAMFEAMTQNMDEVDLYLVYVNIGRDDIVIEFARRCQKPIAIDPMWDFLNRL